MITLRNVTLRRGALVLLKQINWTIYHKQHIGLIGENGSGKSTLFSLLLNQFDADVGEVEIPKNLKFAHMAQEIPAYDRSALDFVLDGDTEWRELQTELEQAQIENDGIRIALLHEKLTIIDGYSATARAAKVLAGLGFDEPSQQKTVNTFSGGWRVRLNLAKALMSRSDVLLLDEPTNHLDLDAVLWLKSWLSTYPGTLLLISHDRDFLDETVDHIAHLHNQELHFYTGNYSTFEKTRAEKLLLQQAIYEKQQKKLAHMQSYVDRFRYKASKARQAQSRLKAIERMEVVSAVQEETPFSFTFKVPEKCGNPLVQLQNVNVGYEQTIILKNINLSIAPKDRIGILGPNGAGKSTLIKLLAGEISSITGIKNFSAGLKIGYFAQHQVDNLRLSESPFEHLRDLAPKHPELELRSFLGSFGFVGDRIFTRVESFSGGEKSRLALALIVWQRPNLLLLDEPTNHLDLDMRNALSLALQEYEGAMLLVSHDRFLVRMTTDNLLLVSKQSVREFDGDLEDYQQWLFEYRRQQGGAKVTSQTKTRKSTRQESAKQRELIRPLLNKIQKLENELAKAEKELAMIETHLTDTALYEDNNKQQLQVYLNDQIKLKKLIEKTEQAWLELSIQKDQLLDEES